MSKQIRSININIDVWDLLDKISKKERRSKSSMIEFLVLEYSKKQK